MFNTVRWNTLAKTTVLSSFMSVHLFSSWGRWCWRWRWRWATAGQSCLLKDFRRHLQRLRWNFGSKLLWGIFQGKQDLERNCWNPMKSIMLFGNIWKQDLKTIRGQQQKDVQPQQPTCSSLQASVWSNCSSQIVRCTAPLFHLRSTVMSKVPQPSNIQDITDITMITLLEYTAMHLFTKVWTFRHAPRAWNSKGGSSQTRTGSLNVGCSLMVTESNSSVSPRT